MKFEKATFEFANTIIQCKNLRSFVKQITVFIPVLHNCWDDYPFKENIPFLHSYYFHEIFWHANVTVVQKNTIVGVLNFILRRTTKTIF